MGRERDRDAQGRAQQARPRDRLGRPLPYGAPGVEPVPDVPRSPQESLQLAEELLREGRPFSAHEVLEARWKDCPDSERWLWQGLAQLCVALTHAERGNAVGARRVADRGARHLTAYLTGDAPTYGVDIDAVISCVRGRVAELVG